MVLARLSRPCMRTTKVIRRLFVPGRSPGKKKGDPFLEWNHGGTWGEEGQGNQKKSLWGRRGRRTKGTKNRNRGRTPVFRLSPSRSSATRACCVSASMCRDLASWRHGGTKFSGFVGHFFFFFWMRWEISHVVIYYSAFVMMLLREGCQLVFGFFDQICRVMGPDRSRSN